MKCIIIDDDPIQQTLLEGYTEEVDGLECVKCYDNPLDFLKDKDKPKFDLLLLDMEMPKMSGVDFLETIDKDFHVVVISSKTEYAIDVINHNVDGYLVKPVKMVDFFKMMEKVKSLSTPVEPKIETPDKDHLYIKSDGMFHKIDYDKILYIGAAVDYIEIFTPEKTYLVGSTMNKIAEKLPESLFFRIHRSSIINLEKIKKIDKDFVEIGNYTLKIAPSKKEEFLKIINSL